MCGKTYESRHSRTYHANVGASLLPHTRENTSFPETAAHPTKLHAINALSCVTTLGTPVVAGAATT